MILQILENLKSANTEIAKKAILKQNENNPTFINTLKLTLSYTEVFHIKSLKEPEFNTNEITLDEAYLELNKLKTGELTGNKAYDYFNDILTKLSSRDANVFMRVIQKRLNCDIGAKTVNSVFPKLIPTMPYMRCSLFDDKIAEKITIPALVQEKMDGQFVNVICKNGKASFYSRSGVEYDFLGVFDNYIPNEDIVIMGELLVEKDGVIADRQTGNGIIQKGCKDTIIEDEANMIFIQAWDIVPLVDFENGICKTPYVERLEKVKSIANNKIRCIETIEITELDEATALAKKYVESGKEGIILKNTNGIWKDGTSKECIKFKNAFEVELKVVGFTEGAKYSYAEGTLGALLCESSDGILKVKVSGMDWDTRNNIWNNQDKYLGQIITVIANKISQDKNGNWSLYLPRFAGFRDDKTEADGLERIISQDKGRI